MLRIVQQSDADAARSYYSAADYYADGRETFGVWGGRGAELLGLHGTVDKEAFGRLCDNLHPETRMSLTPRQDDDRTVGYDFVWSVPKSVSLIYSRTKDDKILDALRGAVRETMNELEREAMTRVRLDGKDHNRMTGNLVWGEFLHLLGRPVDGVPDPQLHIHSFIFNCTFDQKERRWKAAQFRELKRDSPYWQAAFRVRLAGKLQDLGYSLTKQRDDFEITGISKATIKKFSRRTDQIEKVAKEKGITDPGLKAELGAKTRAKKDSKLTWDELDQAWSARLTDQERAQLDQVHAQRSVKPRQHEAEKSHQAIDFAVRHLFETESAVTEKNLLTTALKQGLTAVNVKAVHDALDSARVIRTRHDGRTWLTTPEALAEEERIVGFAREGRGRFRPLVSSSRAISREWLGSDQKRAIMHVWRSRDAVTIIRGAAGTGKTTLMQEAIEGILAAGTDVTVLAPTAAAGRGVLRDEGFASADTVTSFLLDERKQHQAAGSVIWVDEAGLLPGKDAEKLFQIAARIEARVVLVGDRKQHRAVARGEPLRLLEERAGVPVVSVLDIRRQTNQFKSAVSALSRGDTESGFDQLVDFGWVRTVPNGQREQVIAEEYLTSINARKANGERKTALVVSPTHAEGARITDAIRSALKAKGKLKDERTISVLKPVHLSVAERGEAEQYQLSDVLQFHQNAKGFKRGQQVENDGNRALPLNLAERFSVFRREELSVAVGDRIRVTSGGKDSGGKRLNNGDLLTVQGFTPTGELIVDNRRVIPKEFGHLTHGYVMTSQASQGKTVDTVLIGQSAESFPASNQRQLYVSVSRAKEKALVFTDDVDKLRKAVQKPDQRFLATELFSKPVHRSRGWHFGFLRRLSEWSRSTLKVRAHETNRHREAERNFAYGR